MRSGGVITAARLRGCTSRASLFALLGELGLPVAPVAIDADSWRRSGIELSWNGNATLFLAARIEGIDAYVIDGSDIGDDDVRRFLRSLESWNAITKYVAFVRDETSQRISLYDLSPRRELRRLDAEPGNPTAWAVDRLNLLATSEPAELPRLLDRALDRETLTRHFFERFRDAVRDVSRALRDSLPDESDDALAAHALLILSRLLFLYFIQEKGWLAGERRFLVDRLVGCVFEGREFFTCVLRPLFFGCLNTPHADRDANARMLGRVPYLNGGLFEPSSFEERHPSLSLPNELLTRIIEQLFERFAFRIDEGDAAGTHVDPEMLGKVFESLMAADDRAASGSFYTPKAIVDVLTERAICEWLARDDRPTRDLLQSLARGEDASLPPKVASAFFHRLAAITILDPACGSGAFLLSSLGVIERLTIALAAIAGEDVAAGVNLRRAIVERSLFGVDLKPEAVRLCELRLWLAIVAATNDRIDDIQPLPNLDRNILQGNSLLSPTDFLGDARADVYRDWMLALRAQSDLVRRYRHATRDERPALCRLIRGNDIRIAAGMLARTIEHDEEELQRLAFPRRDLFGRLQSIDDEECGELHERIARNRALLQRLDDGELSFFSFDVHFAPVMSAGGFDVVAGNPPWVRNGRIDVAAKRMYADRYRFFRGARAAGSVAFNQPDLSIVFFERALSLASANGVIALLMPAKILNAGYAAPLRRFAESSLSIVALDDWTGGARRHFDADTFPLGVTIAKGRRASLIDVNAAGEPFTMRQDQLAVAGRGSEWSLVSDEVNAILRRIRAEQKPLAETLTRQPVMGVKSGDNERFFLDVEDISETHVRTTDGFRLPLDAVALCVRGRDVRRWRAIPTTWMLWPPREGWRRTPRWLARLAAAREFDPSLLRLAYIRPEHVGIKVVWKDLGRGLVAAVVDDVLRVGGGAVPIVPNQTLYTLDAASIEEAHVIAALLNSTIVNALAVCVAERAKDFHFRYFARTVATLPLPQLPRGTPVWTALARISRRGHQGKEPPGELDCTVAKLYGVTDEEQSILAAFLAQRLGF
ncbi:MAG: hypothetical protein QOI24_30 [Acidobacteriota bacterium]|jgi:hypothetical protein|nr:hypothetical protein [Acidobacteriota bacterium]